MNICLPHFLGPESAGASCGLSLTTLCSLRQHARVCRRRRSAPLTPRCPLRDPANRRTSHLLPIYATFSKSSQRRRRHFSPGNLTSLLIWLIPLWVALLLLLIIPVASGTTAKLALLEELNDATFDLSDSLSAEDIDSDQDGDGGASIMRNPNALHVDDYKKDLGTQKETFVVGEFEDEESLERDEHISDIALSVRATVYSNRLHVDFKHMLYMSAQKALYAVANGASLIKLEAKTLIPLDTYTVPPQKFSSEYCQLSSGCRQRQEINVLAHTPTHPLLLYCSLHYEEHPGGIRRQALTGCAVPDPSNLSENVIQWDNVYYTSADPHRPPIILTPQATIYREGEEDESFLFTAGVASNWAFVSRLRMPDWSNGHINWKGSLFSPRRSFFISEGATVVMAFETSTAVYFLLRERPAAGTPGSSASCCGRDEVASRLMRVCRGDRGGLLTIAENYFGTMAKADLVCQSEVVSEGNGRSHFTFKHVEAAHWDPVAKRLYATFTGGPAAPKGSALCVFDIHGIERSFNGPIAVGASTGNQRDSVKRNPFPYICERFSEWKNMTENERNLGRIGVTFMYRHDPIRPIFGLAVAMTRRSITWTSVFGYQVPGNSLATVLWLTSAKRVSQLVLYEHLDGDATKFSETSISSPVLLGICELRSLVVGKGGSNLLQRLEANVSNSQAPTSTSSWRLHRPPDMGVNEPSDDKNPAYEGGAGREQVNGILMQGDTVFLATTTAIFRFPTENCAMHTSKTACLDSADPHCAWNPALQRCVSFFDQSGTITQLIPAVDGTNNLKCPLSARQSKRKKTDILRFGWSDWQPCRMMNENVATMELDHGSETSQAGVSCLCRICLSETLCNFAQQEISQCKANGVWSAWSSWSKCADKLRFRVRICHDPFGGAQNHHPPLSSSSCIGVDREEEFCLMHPIVPEEVTYPEILSAHTLLKEHPDNRFSVDRNHLVGGILGAFVGIVSTLVAVQIFLRFCHPYRRLKRSKVPRPQHVPISSLDSTVDSRRNIALEHSLLPDSRMYSNPSPLQRSIQSNVSERYNYFVHAPRISVISAEDLSASTGGVYDRLSEQ